MVLAVAIIAYKRKGKGSVIQALRPSAPLPYYAIVAILNFLASTCQYEALGHLSLYVFLGDRMIRHQLISLSIQHHDLSFEMCQDDTGSSRTKDLLPTAN